MHKDFDFWSSKCLEEKNELNLLGRRDWNEENSKIKIPIWCIII